jgi:hypothetical protein
MPFSVDLEFAVEAGKSPPPMRLIGQLRSPFVVTPAFIDFGRFKRGSPNAVQSFSIECAAPVDTIEVGTNLEGLDINSEQIGDGHYCITLRVNANQSPGLMKGEIAISGKSKNRNQLYSMWVPVIGEELGDISVEPQHVVFGALPVGEMAEQTVAIRSRAGYSIQIVTVQPESELTTVRLSDGDGESYLTIRQVVHAPGHQNSSITFNYRLSTEPEKELTTTVPIKYFGISGISRQ